MGYETKLIFVTNHRKKKEGRPVDYCSVVATLEMGKICYDFVGDLIGKLQKIVKPLEELYRNKIKEMEEVHKELFNSDGNWTEELAKLPKAEQDKRYAVYSKIRIALEKKLPFVFEGDDATFEDCYGNLLLVASLKEVKEAIIKSNAKEIAEGNYEFGYRRFNVALKLIEGLEDFGEEVFVILYGH